MIKGIFTLIVIAGITIFITHKGWHKNIYHFLEGNKDTADLVVSKTKAMAKDLTKADTVYIEKKPEKTIEKK